MWQWKKKLVDKQLHKSMSLVLTVADLGLDYNNHGVTKLVTAEVIEDYRLIEELDGLFESCIERRL
uniref:Uncharacterized protein n=1 Tax=Solanum lycopersicum TaxID=4081 RepID=A0A3Q7FM77_SOLLC